MSYYHEFRGAALDRFADTSEFSVPPKHVQAHDASKRLQIIVINMADAPERLAFQTDQLDRFGLPFLRLEAYTPDTLPKDIRRGYWKRWRHPLTPAARAKFLSHALAWDWVATNGPALILEDDVLLARSVPEILRNLESVTGMDHLTLETRGRRKLMAKAHIPIGHGVSGHRLYIDKFGSGAYVLWPEGARKLMARTARHAASTDGIAQWARDVRSYQADPACAIQRDMVENHGMEPYPGVETIKAPTNVPLPVTPMQQVRTNLARIHKLWRALRYSMSASRRRVIVRPEYFDR